MTCEDDDESSCTHSQMDRTTNLLISSNVHYVHLGGDNKNRSQKLQPSMAIYRAPNGSSFSSLPKIKHPKI